MTSPTRDVALCIELGHRSVHCLSNADDWSDLVTRYYWKIGLLTPLAAAVGFRRMYGDAVLDDVVRRSLTDPQLVKEGPHVGT